MFGRLIWEHHNEVMTPESIAESQQTVMDCRELLKSSGVLFEFLAHVDGQKKITVSFSSVEDHSELSQLAEVAADEVKCLILCPKCTKFLRGQLSFADITLCLYI